MMNLYALGGRCPGVGWRIWMIGDTDKASLAEVAKLADEVLSWVTTSGWMSSLV